MHGRPDAPANPPKTHNPSDWADREQPGTIVLFDVDGTLSLSRKTASAEMMQMLEKLKEKVVVAFVGGSDLSKQIEQLGSNGNRRCWRHVA